MSVFSLVTETDAYHYTDFEANCDTQIMKSAYVVLQKVAFRKYLLHQAG